MVKNKIQLNTQSLAKTFAIFCGAYMLLSALIPALGLNILWWNNASLAVLSVFYSGIAPTALGCLMALIWGVVSGAAMGLVIGWLYNKLN